MSYIPLLKIARIDIIFAIVEISILQDSPARGKVCTTIICSVFPCLKLEKTGKKKKQKQNKTKNKKENMPSTGMVHLFILNVL